MRFFFSMWILVVLIGRVAGQAQAPDAGATKAPAETAQQPSTEAAAKPVVADSEELGAAEALIAKSDWKGAGARLKPWLEAHPKDARALFDAGYVADAQNQLDEAVGFYQRAVEADSSSFEAHLSLGLLLARRGELVEARPELVAATELDPGPAGPALKARAWRALAKIDRDVNPPEAGKDLIAALKLTPETTEDTLMAAHLADRAGELDESEAAYRRVLAKEPKSAEANAGLAHLLMVRKQYPEAEALLRAALEQTPDDPALTAQLAAALAAQDKAEAVPLLQKLHDAHPKDAAIARMLAQVLAEGGDWSASDALYVQLLADSPASSDLLVAHGQNLTRLQKFPEAFAAFEKATQSDATNADAWSGLAFAASKTNQPAVTLHALAMRSKYLPDLPSTYFLYATSYDSLHNKSQAAAFYHHFLESSAGKFPNQEWQARQRLQILEEKH